MMQEYNIVMNKLAKSALVIVVAALMVYVAMGMFSFFDVGIDVYGNYVYGN